MTVLAEPPHLVTDIATLRMPDKDLRVPGPDDVIVYDINVERWRREPEALIHVRRREEAGDVVPYDLVMSLTIEEAAAFIETLERGIASAKMQNAVTLP